MASDSAVMSDRGPATADGDCRHPLVTLIPVAKRLKLPNGRDPLLVDVHRYGLPDIHQGAEVTRQMGCGSNAGRVTHSSDVRNVPKNETAHAVACGNGPAALWREEARLTESEVPWPEDVGATKPLPQDQEHSDERDAHQSAAPPHDRRHEPAQVRRED